MILDVYAPSEEKEITLNYINEDATSYNNEVKEYGTSKTKVSYTAPSGLVSVNTISSYNNTGSTITSVMQGTLTDKIEIYDDSKISTMEKLLSLEETDDWRKELESFIEMAVEDFDVFAHNIVQQNASALEIIKFPDSLSTCVCLCRTASRPAQ